MLITYFYDVIIALLKKNVKIIHLNLALVPQADTIRRFSVVDHVLQLAVFSFISDLFRACVQRDTCKFSSKISFTGLSIKNCVILPIFILLSNKICQMTWLQKHFLLVTITSTKFQLKHMLVW